MRVLFVCHRLPYPPSRGGKIRPFNIIKHLADCGHSVTVATLARSREEENEGAGLSDYCAKRLVERVGKGAALARMMVRIPGREPSSMGYFFSPRLKSAIEKELGDTSYDLIMVHCSSVAPYVATVTGIPKVLDFGDMDSQKWLIYARYRRYPLALGYLLEGKKLELAERRLAHQFDLCTCTTRAEFDTLRSMVPGVPSGWFANGVDADFFSPDEQGYDRSLICFVGRMDYFPNQQAVFFFCDHILPELQRLRSEVRFAVVGAAPSRAIRALQHRPGVSVTGTVPDVRAFVRRAALTVAPLQIARGTQNKILESMAMGVPVVASSAAATGVDVVAGQHLSVAAGPEEFLESVLQLLENPSLRDRFAQAGRERVLSHHNWAASMSHLSDLLGSVCAEEDVSRVY